jgi:hypothetical protein
VARLDLPFALSLSLALVLPGCTDDGEQDSGTVGNDGTTTDPGTASATADPDDTGSSCVLGQGGCGCLEGQCVGGTYCVEDVCQLGPQIDVEGQDRAVVGGVLVPVEADVDAESFTWTQIAGPPVEILGAETLQIAVSVPADAPPGQTVTLRLSATRNGVTLDGDVRINILDAVFQDALPTVSDPAQLGSTEGLAFGPTGMWVVSTEGFVSRFDSDGAFIERYEVPGAPVGADYRDENLFIANRDGTGRVERLNTVSGNLSTLFDALGDGGALGEVNLPLFRRLNDDAFEVYVSTRLGQTVLRYASETDSANVFLQDAGVINPNAMTFGPEGNAIYVGAQGHVWRVPLTDGGVGGTPEDYLVLGDDTDITYEVDGLAVDEGNNLWVGCPNASTLFVSHYSVTGPAEISRTFTDVGGGVSRFVNLTFGRGDFERDTLYYTNLGDGTVGRLRVGLEGR